MKACYNKPCGQLGLIEISMTRIEIKVDYVNYTFQKHHPSLGAKLSAGFCSNFNSTHKNVSLEHANII